MKKITVVGLVLASVYLLAETASARILFRGKPAPDCSAFFLTEFGYGYVFSPEGYDFFTTEHGIMFNLNSRYALGGSLYFTTIGDGFLNGVLGFKTRFRRWMNQSWSVDAGMGLRFHGHPEFVGSAALNYKDLAALNIGMDYWRGNERYAPVGANFHTELKLGSYLGSGVHGAALIAAVLILAVVIATGGVGE